MTAVNKGPAASMSPNLQATLGSIASASITLGAGPYDLMRENFPGYKSGGTGVIKVTAATPSTTINTLSGNDAPEGFEVTWIVVAGGTLLFNNLGGAGNTVNDGFQNMAAGQVAIQVGGAATCRRVIATQTAQAYWQFI